MSRKIGDGAFEKFVAHGFDELGGTLYGGSNVVRPFGYGLYRLGPDVHMARSPAEERGAIRDREQEPPDSPGNRENDERGMEPDV